MEILKGAVYTLNAILCIALTISSAFVEKTMEARAVSAFVVGLLVLNTVLIMIGA